MKIALYCFTSLVVLFTAAPSALAQPELQPGLWEHSFEIESQSGQIEAALEQAKKMLESLPPEQREMIESQMAAQGINMDLSSYTTQVCITEDQASRNQFPQPSENCTQSVLEQSENLFRMSFSCDGDPPTSGEGEMRLLSDKEYQGKMTMNTTMNGQAENIVASQIGNWLSADCGSVKPMSN